MKTMWRASWGSVNEYKVIKETEKQVVFLNDIGKEERELKVSNHYSWHNTKGEAKNYLIALERNKIARCKSQIDYYKAQIKKIEAL